MDQNFDNKNNNNENSQKNNNENYLLILPIPILKEIIYYCQVNDWIQLSKTCKTLKKIIEEDEFIWKKKIIYDCKFLLQSK